MNWSEEPWIKVYTRNTASWLELDWRARGLCLEIARHVDKRGRMPLGRSGMRGLATLLHARWDDLREHVDVLVAAGKLSWDEAAGELVLVDHEEMQGARTSGAERMRRHRGRTSGDEGAPPVTPSDTPKHEVTASDDQKEEKRRDQKEESESESQTRARVGDTGPEPEQLSGARLRVVVVPPAAEGPVLTPVAPPRAVELGDVATDDERGYAMQQPLQDHQTVWEKFIAHHAALGSRFTPRERLARWAKWIADELPRQRRDRDRATVGRRA